MPRLTPLFSTLPPHVAPTLSPPSPHCMKGYALYIRFHETQNSLNLFFRVGLPTLPTVSPTVSPCNLKVSPMVSPTVSPTVLLTLTPTVSPTPHGARGPLMPRLTPLF